MSLVDKLVAQGFVRPAAAASAVWVTSVAEALDAVELGLARGRADPVAGDVVVYVLAPEAVRAVVAVLGAGGGHRHVEPAAAAAEAVRATVPSMRTAMGWLALVARQAVDLR